MYAKSHMAIERFRLARERRQRRIQIDSALAAKKTPSEHAAAVPYNEFGPHHSAPDNTPYTQEPKTTADKWKSFAKVAVPIVAVGVGTALVGQEIAKRRKDDKSDAKPKEKLLARFATNIVDRAISSDKTPQNTIKNEKGDSKKENKDTKYNEELAAWINEATGVTMTAAGAGVVAGLLGVMGITIEPHRNLTHKSLKPHEWISKAIRFEQKTLGVKDLTIWAAAHRGHHRWTDFRAKRFIHAARAVEWIQKEEAAGRKVDVEVPKHFKHFDPRVPEFPADRAIKIGQMAEFDAASRMGDAFERPTNYTSDQIKEMLYPEEEDFYPDYKKKKPDDYTSDEIMDMLTSDPHSPLYEPGTNGVRGTFKNNFSRYKYRADLFRNRPEFKDPDLQTENDKLPPEERKDEKVWPYVVAGFALPAAGVLLSRGKYEPKDFAIAAIGGAAVNGARAGLEIFGGNTTNALGHSGDAIDLVRKLFKKDYLIPINPDGTLATDTTLAGVVGKIISLLTLDEVGRQKDHHDRPGEPAYSAAQGAQKWMEATWGSSLEAIANSSIPLFEPGEGFDLDEDERRPDDPHKAMDLVMLTRREQRVKEEYELAA